MFILIVIYTILSSSPSVSFQEFNSKSQCEIAAEFIKSDAKLQIKTYCIKK